MWSWRRWCWGRRKWDVQEGMAPEERVKQSAGGVVSGEADALPGGSVEVAAAAVKER